MQDRFPDIDATSALLPPHIAQRDPALVEFLDYWYRMRHGQDVPARSDIDPRGIEAMLSNAFIAERIAPGLARFRIAGTGLADLMGMEVRGMPLSAFLEPSSRDRLADALTDLFDRPAIVAADLISKSGFCRDHLHATLLLLPLKSDLGDISRAIGCLVVSGPARQTPCRFNITDIRITAVTSADQPTATPPNPARIPGPVPYANLSPRGSERSYLRLVKPCR